VRERLGKLVAAGLVAVIVLLAGFFARRQNPSASPGSARSAVAPAPTRNVPDSGRASTDMALIARGRAVFVSESCLRCHSLEGDGNPRLPLDGVGRRRSSIELRAWVTAAASVRTELSGSAIRAKEGFAELPEPDLEALLAFLSSLE
jgi:mono/diheme cytochrome c family protein